MRKAAQSERDNQMKRLFLRGETLHEIGQKYGVSRERVRQILSRFGVTGKDGGAKKRGEDNKDRRLQERQYSCMERWGCTLEQWEYLRGFDKDYYATPIGQYAVQKYNAKKRGIEFTLTLWEWWEIWRDSGRYKKRGRCDGEYVMARFLDKGAYDRLNVYITTCNENIKHYHTYDIYKKCDGFDVHWLEKDNRRSLTPEEFYESCCDDHE